MIADDLPSIKVLKDHVHNDDSEKTCKRIET